MSKRFVRRFVLPLFLAAAVMGCGEEETWQHEHGLEQSDAQSGGGDSADEGEGAERGGQPVGPSPAILATVPAASSSADPAIVVRLVFSTPMDAELSATAFSLLEGAERVEGSTTWDTRATVLAFRPAEPLALGQHTVRVDATASDAEGNLLVPAFEITFEVSDSGAGIKPR